MRYKQTEQEKIEQTKALKEAIKKAGSARKLGLLIGCSTEQIGMWVFRKIVPPQYVLPIERATGVARYRLRSDIYPPEEYSKYSVNI